MAFSILSNAQKINFFFMYCDSLLDTNDMCSVCNLCLHEQIYDTLYT